MSHNNNSSSSCGMEQRFLLQKHNSLCWVNYKLVRVTFGTVSVFRLRDSAGMCVTRLQWIKKHNLGLKASLRDINMNLLREDIYKLQTYFLFGPCISLRFCAQIHWLIIALHPNFPTKIQVSVSHSLWNHSPPHYPIFSFDWYVL